MQGGDAGMGWCRLGWLLTLWSDGGAWEDAVVAERMAADVLKPALIVKRCATGLALSPLYNWFTKLTTLGGPCSL